MSGIITCPDGHRCENGSACVESPYDEGKYYCDSNEGIFDTAYSGLFCEHRATSYCTFSGEVSKISFCTNNGECNALVSPESAHVGCHCPPNYTGENCQFVKGVNVPPQFPNDVIAQPPETTLPISIEEKQAISGLVLILGIIVSVLAFALGLVAGIFLCRRRKMTEEKAEDKRGDDDNEENEEQGEDDDDEEYDDDENRKVKGPKLDEGTQNDWENQQETLEEGQLKESKHKEQDLDENQRKDELEVEQEEQP